MGSILAICTSSAKGTPKSSVALSRCIEDFGIEGDAQVFARVLQGGNVREGQDINIMVME